MCTVQHLKHKKRASANWHFLIYSAYLCPDWTIQQPGLLDIYQDSWMFNIQDSLIMHDSWLNRHYNVFYSKNSYNYANTNKLYNNEQCL